MDLEQMSGFRSVLGRVGSHLAVLLPAFFLAAPQGYTPARPVPGQSTSRNGVVAGRVDVGCIRQAIRGGQGCLLVVEGVPHAFF